MPPTNREIRERLVTLFGVNAQRVFKYKHLREETHLQWYAMEPVLKELADEGIIVFNAEEKSYRLNLSS